MCKMLVRCRCWRLVSVPVCGAFPTKRDWLGSSGMETGLWKNNQACSSSPTVHSVQPGGDVWAEFHINDGANKYLLSSNGGTGVLPDDTVGSADASHVLD